MIYAWVKNKLSSLFLALDLSLKHRKALIIWRDDIFMNSKRWFMPLCTLLHLVHFIFNTKNLRLSIHYFVVSKWKIDVTGIIFEVIVYTRTWKSVRFGLYLCICRPNYKTWFCAKSSVIWWPSQSPEPWLALLVYIQIRNIRKLRIFAN